jgi:hypothetical protein
MSESLPLPSPSVTSRLPAPASWSGWTAVLTDNGSEFRAGSFVDSLTGLGVEQRRIRAGRPQTNGHVERLQQTILERRGRSPTRESRARCAHRRVNILFRAFGHNLDYLAGRRRADLVRVSFGSVLVFACDEIASSIERCLDRACHASSFIGWDACQIGGEVGHQPRPHSASVLVQRWGTLSVADRRLAQRHRVCDGALGRTARSGNLRNRVEAELGSQCERFRD